MSRTYRYEVVVQTTMTIEVTSDNRDDAEVAAYEAAEGMPPDNAEIVHEERTMELELIEAHENDDYDDIEE